MDRMEEREVLRLARKRRGDDLDELGEETEEEFLNHNFEDPARSDVLFEKQVREGKRKR